MTDNEIIKALDCFSGKEIYCKNCAYRDNSNMGICRRNAAKDTIDLINRQRAEIEDLKETLSIFREDMHLIVDRRRHEAIKEFAERLENKLGQMFLVKHKCVVEAIDNLVKEMVGDM